MHSPRETPSRLFIRYPSTSFTSSLTDYSQFEKVKSEELAPCRPTGMSSARCERRRPAVYRLIHSSRARCTEYMAHSPFKNSANEIQVRQQLAIKYGLNIEKKKKPIMRAEDEFELLKTLHLLVEMIFDHERHRVQLALLMQLASITGNRPSALLGVCYSDIKITLLPDPQGDKFPRRLIEIAFKHTKGYLGEKETFVFFSMAFSSYRVI